MCVCVFLCCVVLCVGRGLASGWSPNQGVLPNVYRIEKSIKEGIGPQRTVESHRKKINLHYFNWKLLSDIYEFSSINFLLIIIILILKCYFRNVLFYLKIKISCDFIYQVTCQVILYQIKRNFRHHITVNSMFITRLFCIASNMPIPLFMDV